MLNKGEIYKNFYVIDVIDVPDFKSKGIYLRHKTTGLEVFHLLNDDPENLFSFVFRTPVTNNKGAPHILEHSVLCGSEKYHLKEPFITLAGKSASTFLNALTGPDKTMYPGATLIPKQYYIMMDCYADSVFFPELSKETFMQEAHRFELDEDGKLSIQGVVYNEMKGSFSNYFRSVYSSLISAMFPGSNYDFESGGDPLEIPSFTYEEFRDFHKKYYSPENCLLFLYGNIKTEEQLDFFDKEYIPRLEKKYGFASDRTVDCFKDQKPFVDKDIYKALHIEPDYERVADFHFQAPKAGSDGSFAGICIYSGEQDISKWLLTYLLSGSDSSRLTKALKESGLGDDVYIGTIDEGGQEFFAIGLIGVKDEDIPKVKPLIFETVNQIYKEGITQEEIDAAVMAIDFNLREENRYSGPKSIELMSKVSESWVLGNRPEKLLNPITSFEAVKKEISSDPDYVKKLFEKYLINVKGNIFVVVEPTDKYLEDRSKKEAQMISEAEKTIDKELLKKELDALHDYQQSVDSEKDLESIRRLDISELPVEIHKCEPEFTKSGDIIVLKNQQETNGIVYFEIFFPADRFTPEQFIHLPMFNDTLLDLGWKGKDWDKCILEANQIAGDISTGIQVGTVQNCQFTKASVEKYKDANFIGREWIYFTMKILDEKLEKGLHLMADIITGNDFKDTERMKTLIRECVSERKLAISQNGMNFAIKRSKMNTSRSTVIQELIYGATQVNTGMKYKEEDADSMLKDFSDMYDTLRDSGSLIRIIADEKSLSHASSLVPSFIKEAELKALKPSGNLTKENLEKMMIKNEKDMMDVIKTDTQVGYAATTFRCSPSCSKEFEAEDVLTSWMGTHPFWEKLRTIHGCYGANISIEPGDEVTTCSTYRDPDPAGSISIFEECINETAEHNFTKEETDCALLTIYASCTSPMTPQGYGKTGCTRFLYGHTDEMVRKDLEMKLQVKTEEVIQAAKRFKEDIKNSSKALVCDKNFKISGNILELPL